ncbi:hypothetical protein H1230_09355 [Paenibacillus sp. 19GGS1-52]|uniref:hypothetical protein n=1 Tax=Paenibacillus sp. 19GGS1-52 TaxID=2758563 RepID=UPI001EFADB67|nr:hypothetical protein [Paenibacillus sp. 19GGS1-52]ULO08952.1 hypothetical protein H1230_09355 [Paenibacillus sp. 19GGS1-52]
MTIPVDVQAIEAIGSIIPQLNEYINNPSEQLPPDLYSKLIQLESLLMQPEINNFFMFEKTFHEVLMLKGQLSSDKKPNLREIKSSLECIRYDLLGDDVFVKVNLSTKKKYPSIYPNRIQTETYYLHQQPLVINRLINKHQNLKTTHYNVERVVISVGYTKNAPITVEIYGDTDRLIATLEEYIKTTRVGISRKDDAFYYEWLGNKDK